MGVIVFSSRTVMTTTDIFLTLFAELGAAARCSQLLSAQTLSIPHPPGQKEALNLKSQQQVYIDSIAMANTNLALHRWDISILVTIHPGNCRRKKKMFGSKVTKQNYKIKKGKWALSHNHIRSHEDETVNPPETCDKWRLGLTWTFRWTATIRRDDSLVMHTRGLERHELTTGPRTFNVSNRHRWHTREERTLQNRRSTAPE